MSEPDEHDLKEIATCLRQQATAHKFRIMVHAHQELVEDDVSLKEVREVLLILRLLRTILNINVDRAA